VDGSATDALAWADHLTHQLTKGRVIDLGCGEGRFLPPRGVGLDVDPARLAAARERSSLLVRGDAHSLPFRDATFDTAYAHRMLNDAGRVDDVLAEVGRVLRPDGRVLIFTRARRESGDRLDRENGADRLRRFFERVEAILHPTDERAALFVADVPRGRRGATAD
jgi:ubiquinone/menaquinone biosynthesis C-methylase UbiE